MVHERRVQTAPPSQPASAGQTSRPASMPSQTQTATVFSQLQADIRALNSSVLILSQKMQYLVRNEKILGRNLIVLSKRIREIESNGIGGGQNSGVSVETAVLLKDLSAKVETQAQKMLELQNELSDVKEHYAKIEALKEMKYVIDTINPMDFITLKQFDELFEQKMKKRK
ncbi:MAG: hypothetical protein J4215_02665 [Candidatus Diapherotrites archaeon]|uniref:Uncharacterized protein n=1 Tax=Candidatus Iainarchaeum sp. TaxID=3101447 RepID=A0A8T4L2H4_9ARCH|nr:hypothetical protein [Candidatus Diapherotrites archaeon]